MTYENEIWKDIPGYEGSYQVSDHGRVRSLDRLVPHSGHKTGFRRIKGRIIKLCNDTDGYQIIQLHDGLPHMQKVHRLVARSFIGLPPKKRPQVNHIDGDKTNNHPCNLEYASQQQNTDHAVNTGLHNLKGARNPTAKITVSDVLAIRRFTKEYSSREIKEALGLPLAVSTIWQIRVRKSWKHIK